MWRRRRTFFKIFKLRTINWRSGEGCRPWARARAHTHTHHLPHLPVQSRGADKIRLILVARNRKSSDVLRDKAQSSTARCVCVRICRGRKRAALVWAPAGCGFYRCALHHAHTSTGSSEEKQTSSSSSLKIQSILRIFGSWIINDLSCGLRARTCCRVGFGCFSLILFIYLFFLTRIHLDKVNE